jgi:hypothetical protein
MRTTYTALTEVPEALRAEYEQRGSVFVLKLEGDPHPDVAAANAKLAEFRDNNIVLMKDKERLTGDLAKFKDVDPVKYVEVQKELDDLKKRGGKGSDDVQAAIRAAVKDAVDPLQKTINEEKEKRETAERKLAQTALETKLREVGAKLKVEEKALPDFLARGLRVFGVDGIARDGEKELYSKEDPSKRLEMDEWGKGLFIEAPHLFVQSKGGGAAPGSVGPGGKRTISSSDPVELGRNMDAIAKGEVIVLPPG